MVNPLLQAQEDYLREASQRGETMRNMPTDVIDAEKERIANATQRGPTKLSKSPRKHHIMGIKSKNASKLSSGDL